MDLNEEISRMIFNSMLRALRSRGFSDVITFSLGEEFSNNSELIYDSDSALDRLVQMSENEFGSYKALNILINSSLRYFKLVSEIPKKYDVALGQLEENKGDNPIGLNTYNGQTINVKRELDDPIIKSLIQTLIDIHETLESNDDSFSSPLQ